LTKVPSQKTRIAAQSALLEVLVAGKESVLVQSYPEATVGGLIVNDKGEILLVRSYKWGNKYTVPGGHIELGERSEAAIKREVKEEVGLDVEPVKLLMVQEAIFPVDYVKHEHYIFMDYLCRSKSSAVNVDGEEIQEYLWVGPGRALELELESFTRNLVTEYLKDAAPRKTVR
jgi:nucleoside triphosphatase